MRRINFLFAAHEIRLVKLCRPPIAGIRHWWPAEIPLEHDIVHDAPGVFIFSSCGFAAPFHRHIVVDTGSAYWMHIIASENGKQPPPCCHGHHDQPDWPALHVAGPCY